MKTQNIILKKVLLSLLALAGIFAAQTTLAQSDRNTSEYNLQNGVGLKGYDPVAVFPEGGGKPSVGLSQLQLNYLGVIYLFATTQNRDAFALNPGKYEPTYGGWCAYAMGKVAKQPSKVDIQPLLFTIHGNRAHYFVAKRAKAEFDQDIMTYETNADENWKTLSGEVARR
jgi:YHS domain-containing protein